jgi:hypothetical protein
MRLDEKLRTEDQQRQLVEQMADALRILSTNLLDSGTARWGIYEKAGLINFADRQKPDPTRIEAHTDGIVHTPLDRAAVDRKKRRRSGVK